MICRPAKAWIPSTNPRAITLFSLGFTALFFFAPPSKATEPVDPLEIYVLKGDAARLNRFQSEIGKGWSGGEFLARLSTKTEYRYWAYPTREAREARTFMFGSMTYGLALEFEPYDEAKAYPSERAVLDGITSQCGARPNPFSIKPNRTLQIKLQAGEKFEVADCIMTKVDAAKFGEALPIGFVGNEAIGEKR